MLFFFPSFFLFSIVIVIFNLFFSIEWFVDVICTSGPLYPEDLWDKKLL